MKFSFKVIVFIHNSPFQIMNALEFLYQNEISLDETLFLCSCPKISISTSQIQEILSLEKIPFYKFIYQESNPILNTLNFFELLDVKEPEFYLVPITSVDLAYFIPSMFPNVHVVFYDEGAHSLRLSENQSDRTLIYPSQGLMGKLKRKLLQLSPIKISSFFTSYDLKGIPSELVQKNVYNRFKKEISKQVFSNEIAFIGQPIFQLSSEDKYIHFLLQLKSCFPEFVYFAHRHDNESFLKKLSTSGIRIERPHINIEYYFSIKNQIPSMIIGITSSALFSLHLIYGEMMNLSFVKYPENDLNSKEVQRRFNEVYQQFEIFGIKEYKQNRNKSD